MATKRPVAFRVPRTTGDGDTLSHTEFRLFADEREAATAAEEIGADYEGLYLVQDRMPWRDINTLPTDDVQVLAATEDGRVMIWSTEILSRVMSGKQPFHLQFPANRWMHIPSA